MRVYGILMMNGSVLISDEYIRGMNISKFPGGGLELGEGTIDCLVREFREELNLDVRVTSHFYTTDFFVASAFDPQSQVISIYYIVEPLSDLNFRVSEREFDYEPVKDAQSFRWKNLRDLKDTDLSLIIDQKVAAMVKGRFGQ